jgi:hypothetical protein
MQCRRILAGCVACRADVETTLLVPALRHTTSLQADAERSAATVVECPLLHLLKIRCNNSARPAHTTVQSDVPQTYVVGFTSLNTDDFLRSRLADRD